MVVPDGAAGLDDVLYAALAGTLHLSPKGKKASGPRSRPTGGDPLLFSPPR